jgi:MraZ protein
MLAGTLDKKGRVCIPSPFRNVLSAQNTNGVYIRISVITPSLECFGATVMQKFFDAQTASDPFFTAAHETESFLLSLTQDLALDETGRVRLPDEFITHAGLSEAITFVGMVSKFEIWDTARYAPVYAERMAAAQALLRAKQQGPRP